MKHRPFSELTKDWSPERKARVAAMTAQLVDELEAEKREGRRGQAPRRGFSQPAGGGVDASSGKTHAMTGPPARTGECRRRGSRQGRRTRPRASLRREVLLGDGEEGREEDEMSTA